MSVVYGAVFRPHLMVDLDDSNQERAYIRLPFPSEGERQRFSRVLLAPGDLVALAEGRVTFGYTGQDLENIKAGARNVLKDYRGQFS